MFDELISAVNHRPPEARTQTLARLRSVACRSASAWLEALPTAYSLRLSDGDFRAALQRHLGSPNSPTEPRPLLWRYSAPLDRR
jgi:hypothetical protein